MSSFSHEKCFLPPGLEENRFALPKVNHLIGKMKKSADLIERGPDELGSGQFIYPTA
jgi:hypothetical protein